MALVPLKNRELRPNPDPRIVLDESRVTLTRVPIAGAARLLTVERAEDLPRVEALYGPAEGALVRVRPALGEDGESLSRALLEAGAAAVRVGPGAVEGMPELTEADPDGTPRELALRRARGLQTDLAGEVEATVEQALGKAGL